MKIKRKQQTLQNVKIVARELVVDIFAVANAKLVGT